MNVICSSTSTVYRDHFCQNFFMDYVVTYIFPAYQYQWQKKIHILGCLASLNQRTFSSSHWTQISVWSFQLRRPRRFSCDVWGCWGGSFPSLMFFGIFDLIDCYTVTARHGITTRNTWIFNIYHYLSQGYTNFPKVLGVTSKFLVPWLWHTASSIRKSTDITRHGTEISRPGDLRLLLLALISSA